MGCELKALLLFAYKNQTLATVLQILCIYVEPETTCVKCSTELHKQIEFLRATFL